MISDLEKAKESLISGGYTCVICKGKTEVFSFDRGVKPLVKWLKEESGFEGFSAADKVVGKATAFLYTLLKVKAIYANVISESALAVLKNYGIYTEYSELVPNIINRQKDGICPFESAVLETENNETAYRLIVEKMSQMNITV